MNKFYIAAIWDMGGKYFAQVLTFSEGANLAWGLSDLYRANIYPTKKKATEVVIAWNQSFNANGTYYY